MENLDRQTNKRIRVRGDEEIDKSVTRPNDFDEFISLISDKPDLDVIIAAALGYLLAGFVKFVAGGIRKHIFKKDRP